MKYKIIGFIICMMLVSSSGIALSSKFALDSITKPLSIGNKTLYVGGSGPGNYTKIQDAVDYSKSGDTIYIYNDSSPYVENVYVKEKAINIVGEDTNTTIIDAGGGNEETNWTMVVSHSSGFSMSNLTLQNCTSTKGTNYAFFSQHSDNMNITNCRIRDSIQGMRLQYCANTYMRKNRFENNSMNFDLSGWGQASDFINDIDTSNTINGKPIYNLVNKSDMVLDGIDVGWFGLIYCTNITVKNITNSKLLINTDLSTIINCTGSIRIGFDSDNNIIKNCPSLGWVGFITNNPTYQPYKNTPNFNTVSNCNFKSGVSFQQSNYNNITNCNFSIKRGSPNPPQWDGIICFYDSSYNTISNCFISNILNCGKGIQLQAFPTRGSGCNYNNIIDNTFYNFTKSAINITYKSTHNKIIGNHIINCSNYPELAGIYIHDFSSNDHNLIYNNTFINNSRGAYDDSKNYWNKSYPIGGNYWDDYEGEDDYRGPNQDIHGPDGLGDIPYNIYGYGNNKDYYPLMYEWGENPPVANFSFIVNKYTVFFNASSSYDRDGTVESYEWDFSDYTSGEGMIINHTYSENGTYYVVLWVIDDDGKQGDWSSNGFHIPNYAPYAPSDPYPPDSANDVDIDVDFSWTCSDPDGDELYYDVYFGNCSPPPKISSNQSSTTYDPGILDFETLYYWKIVAWDEYGATTSGSIWNFITETNLPPYEPSDPDPEDGTTDVSINADLRWTGGDPNAGDTVKYDVYFGTDSGPPKVSSNQSTTSYNPDRMEFNISYYWQIVSWDSMELSTTGPVWQFTTEKTEPDLDCSGSLRWTDVEPGETVTGGFTVENIGETGSLLDWKIVDWPKDWGSWTFTPSSGTDLTLKEPFTVNVSVIAPDVKNSEFTGEITIVNKENTSDFCTIDVSLVTPKNKHFNFFFNLLERRLDRFPILQKILDVLRLNSR